MVESTALEMRRTGNRTVGSSPTLSANFPTRPESPYATPRQGLPSRADSVPGIGVASQFGTGKDGIFVACPTLCAGTWDSDKHGY